MILDRALGTAGDEHQRIGARRQRLVHRVLDERLVDDRQHFLRARLGDGQKSRAAAGNREYGGFYGFDLPWSNDSGFSAQFNDSVGLKPLPGVTGGTMPVKAAACEAAFAAPIASPRARAMRRSRGRCARHRPRPACHTACSVASCANTVSIAARSGAASRQSGSDRGEHQALQLSRRRARAPAPTNSASTASRRSAPTRRSRCGQLFRHQLRRLAQRRAQQPHARARDRPARSAICARSTAARGNGDSSRARLAQQAARRVDLAALDRRAPRVRTGNGRPPAAAAPP